MVKRNVNFWYHEVQEMLDNLRGTQEGEFVMPLLLGFLK